MKILIKRAVITIFAAWMITIQSCKKETLSSSPASPPILTTTEVAFITRNTAVSGGDISYDGGEDIFVRGVCWSTNSDPTVSDYITTDGSGMGTYYSYLSGLTPGTTYKVRAYAINNSGTTYGSLRTFTTDDRDISSILPNPGLNYGTVSDIDGNVYRTIQIVAQTWMAENLKTTRFNDGEAIPLVESNRDWSNLSAPGYSWYNNEPAVYKDVYGALYNWSAAASGKLCPVGWHVPDTADFIILYNSLGANDEVGSSMKETGSTHWFLPNEGATNSSGWTGLPGGLRRNDGIFVNYRFLGLWWTTSAIYNQGFAISAYLNSEITNLYLLDYSSMKSGSSVRCLKN